MSHGTIRSKKGKNASQSSQTCLMPKLLQNLVNDSTPPVSGRVVPVGPPMCPTDGGTTVYRPVA